MVVANHASVRYKTLSAALNIIDPEGAFVPGTIEHNWATEEILTWMAEMEPDEVLKKSASARSMFRNKRLVWQWCTKQLSAHNNTTPTLGTLRRGFSH